jgi:hypothetical protein
MRLVSGNIRKGPVLAGFCLFLITISVSAQSLFSGDWYLFSNLQVGSSTLETGESFSSTSFYSGLRFYSSNFSFSISLPIIFQRGNGLISDSSGTSINPGFNSGNFQEFHTTGFGDAYFTADYLLFNDLYKKFQISISFESKIPTASDGLGTGKFDFGGYINARKYFRSYFLLFNAGYLLMGDTEEIEFDNPVVLGIGGGSFTFNHSLGIFLYYEQYSSWIPNTDPPKYSVLGLSYKLNPNVFLSSYFQKGFTDSSPDLLFSIGIDLKLNKEQSAMNSIR